jgi:hypothetical protein
VQTGGCSCNRAMYLQFPQRLSKPPFGTPQSILWYHVIPVLVCIVHAFAMRFVCIDDGSGCWGMIEAGRSSRY